jgi:hypothetical protein
MRLELTFSEERAGSTEPGAAYLRAFETIDQVSKVLAEGGVPAADANKILRPCDLAERDWNNRKASDDVISLDRRQITNMGFELLTR